MTQAPTASGKRIVLVILALVALWGIILAILVWRGTKTPHHTRVRDTAGEASGK